MNDAAFIADTNVVHWVDINSLTGDVFTTDRNLSELERIPPEERDVVFRDETYGYFERNAANVLSDSHLLHGYALRLYSNTLYPYTDLLVKNIIGSCIREGWRVGNPRDFADHVARIYKGRLGNHREVGDKMSAQTREELEEMIKRLSFAAGVRILDGKDLYYGENFAVTDRRVVAAAYILPYQDVYILSNDVDVKQLCVYAKLLWGNKGVRLADSRGKIPEHLKIVSPIRKLKMEK